MKMIKYQKTLLFTAFTFLAACQDQVTQDITKDNNETLETYKNVNYAISQEEALANLTDFLESEKNNTRGIKGRKIVAIYTVKAPSQATRSIDSEHEAGNLLYVANFEDSTGYAILAADSRISDKVIAVTESGFLSEDIMEAATKASNQNKPIIDQYPANGPGFFTDPRYGDELFINPNTVNFYIESENDTLVGNYEDNEDVGNPNNQNSAVNSEGSFIKEYTSALCIDYAMNEINGGNDDRDGKDDDDESSDESDSIDTPPGSIGSSTDSIKIKNLVSEWRNVRIQSSILSEYRTWTQNPPFNNLCPRRRHFLKFWEEPKKAPAGCFPLAVAKILTHFSKPDVFTYNGVTVNWDGLKSKDYLSVDVTSVATLLRGIGAACDSWYFNQGTFTFPNEVTAFLRRIGYSNAHSRDYSFERVTDMIDKGKPIIIYGMPGIDITSSHSWNIDGYKVKARTLTKNVYRNGTLISSTEKIETINMVHCDLGWGGDCNGYYVSGVFKLNDPNSEKDSNSNQNQGKKFTTMIKLITYEMP